MIAGLAARQPACQCVYLRTLEFELAVCINFLCPYAWQGPPSQLPSCS
jgi:hypothetical protein